MDWQIKAGGVSAIVTMCNEFLKRRIFRYSSFILIILLAWSNSLAACPGLLFIESLPLRGKYQMKREQLRLYSLQKNESGWYWQPIALQFDPYDSSGRMLFPESKSWISESLTPTDRISFSTEHFSLHQYTGQYRLPCGAKDGIAIQDRIDTSKYAYLLACDSGTPMPQFSSPVSYNDEQHEVVSDLYRYRHDKKNHLMFREIAVKSGDDYHVVATDSDQLIRGDIRKFLTLNFDGHDIHAEISDLRYGPMGLVGLLRFRLNILAFQIELALTPEVQFFASSLFMPMSLHIPVEAQKYLNVGSGIFYTWQSPGDIVWKAEQSQVTEYGKSDLESALNFCQGQFCRYSITGSRNDVDFSLRFVIPRYLVNLGFFPQLLLNSSPVQEKIKRPVSRFSDEKRIGFFFETSQLPKGNHNWDFWLHFGSDHRECPLPVRLKPLPRIKP